MKGRGANEEKEQEEKEGEVEKERLIGVTGQGPSRMGRKGRERAE